MAEEEKADMEKIIKAVEQYWQTGKVTDITCERCGGLIQITPLGETNRAFSASCPCGLYHDTLRGL